MALSVFAARMENGEVYAATYYDSEGCGDREEIQEWLREGGVPDPVIAFMPIPENNASVVLAGLVQLREFSEDFDRFLTDVFKLGMEAERNAK